MRIFEIVLFIVNCLTVTAFIFNTQENRGAAAKRIGTAARWFLTLGGVVILVVHHNLEGLRWQLSPLYLLSLLLVVLILIKKGKPLQRTGRAVLTAFAEVLLISSVVLGVCFPVAGYQSITGKYQVGTLSTLLVTEKEEFYTDNPGDNRQLMLQFWYPAVLGRYSVQEKTADRERNPDQAQAVNDGFTKAPWLSGGKTVATGIARMMNLPPVLTGYLTLIKSNSYLEAALSSDRAKYPLVIISHGWTGFRNIHNNLGEMLASNGYIAVGIDHTYGAAATVLSGNKEPDRQAFLKSTILPARSAQNFIQAANQLVNTYAGDIISTMDYLEDLNNTRESDFYNRLNLSRTGVLGHSTGGGGCVKAAILDKRISSVIGMDPWVEPLKLEYINQGLAVPALYLRSEEWKDSKNNLKLFALQENSPSTEIYSIEGAYHNDFTMINAVIPVTDLLHLTGPIDYATMRDITYTAVLNFFNRTLLEKTTPNSLDLENRFTEVNLITF